MRARIRLKLLHKSRVRIAFDHLMDRLHRRLYPETADTLAFYWLKTLYYAHYKREEWAELDALIARTAAPDDADRRILQNVRNWIRDEGLLNGHAPAAPDSPMVASSWTGAPDQLAPYFARLLNEWLPKEVARMLIDEPEEGPSDSRDIPVTALARAIERLLVRDRLNGHSLEWFVQGAGLSPERVYAADYEIARDVALFLLGRTEAPAFPVLPATLLSVASDACLPSNYADAVRRAWYKNGDDGDEIHVPVTPEDAARILEKDQICITSSIISMDGRWWQAEKLRSAEQSAIVYRPAGRLRMDDAGGHLRLQIPWPEMRFEWGGAVEFETRFELFGRVWRVAEWIQDGTHTTLSLVFDRALPAAAKPAHVATLLRPAAVEMAWTALGEALIEAVKRKNVQVIDQLRREELIPLARALFEFQTVTTRRIGGHAAVEPALRKLVYHAGVVESAYGRIPWRVVPEKARPVLLRSDIRPIAEVVFELPAHTWQAA